MTVSVSIASRGDEKDILSFLLSDYVKREPLTSAVQLKPEQMAELLAMIVDKCVSSGTSVVIRSNKGSVVAVRLSTIIDKEEEEESDETEYARSLREDNLKTPEHLWKIERIGTLLDKLHEDKWEAIHGSRVLFIAVIAVSQFFCGRGFGKFLACYDMDTMLKRGVCGAIAEATARPSQAIFAKLGYRILREIVHADYRDETGNPMFVCPNGTKSIQLVYLPLV